MQVHAFPDTNYFIQYKALDQIDWCKLLAADSVILQITPAVLGELNHKKDYSSSRRQQNRAGSALSLLRSIDRGEAKLSAGVEVEFISHHADDATFSSHRLTRLDSDDSILAAAVEHALNTPTANVYVITGDFGVEIRARRLLKIKPFCMPDDCKLPAEPDAEAEEIKRLKKQVAELQNTIPNLRLSFAGKDFYTLTYLEPMSSRLLQTCEEMLATAQQDHPKMEKKKNLETPVDNLMAQIAGLNALDPKDIADYNKKVDDYYDSLSRYHDKLQCHLSFLQNTAKLNISIQNDGTTPADQIEVELHFPDGFLLYTEAELHEPPREPKPPKKPRTTLESLSDMQNIGFPSPYFPIYEPNTLNLPFSNVSLLSKKHGNSYTVKFRVAKLKHHTSEPLDQLFVSYAGDAANRSFQIRYKLLADNLPAPVSGTLNLIDEKTQMNNHHGSD